jgi:hypothetical protein
MSIIFKPDKISTYTGFKQYNYDSPWVIRVQTTVNKDGHKIQRHKEFGEVPDLKWYMQFPEFQDN